MPVFGKTLRKEGEEGMSTSEKRYRREKAYSKLTASNSSEVTPLMRPSAKLGRVLSMKCWRVKKRD